MGHIIIACWFRFDKNYLPPYQNQNNYMVLDSLLYHLNKKHLLDLISSIHKCKPWLLVKYNLEISKLMLLVINLWEILMLQGTLMLLVISQWKTSTMVVLVIIQCWHNRIVLLVFLKIKLNILITSSHHSHNGIVIQEPVIM